MNLVPMKKVVAIVEAAIEQDVFKKLAELGARSYTWFPCSGRGDHKVDEMAFFADSQIRIELITTHETATKIFEYLHSKEFTNRAIFSYLESVEVWDPAHRA